MRTFPLILFLSVWAAAAPRRSFSEPSKPPARAAVRRKTLRPLSLLRRIGRAEPDFALRLSSWGIKPDRRRDGLAAGNVYVPETPERAAIPR